MFLLCRNHPVPLLSVVMKQRGEESTADVASASCVEDGEVGKGLLLLLFLLFRLLLLFIIIIIIVVVLLLFR